MKYVVRDQFVIKMGREVYEGGDVIELTDEEAENHAHQIELADPKAAAKAAKAEAKAAAEAEAAAAEAAAAEAAAAAAAAGNESQQ